MSIPKLWGACVFSEDTCILFSVASSSPGVAQTLDSVTLSVRVCFAMFLAVMLWLFDCFGYLRWLFCVQLLACMLCTLPLVFAHFAYGVASLKCRRRFFLLKHANVQCLQVRYSQVRHAWVHGAAFNAKGWWNWIQRCTKTSLCLLLNCLWVCWIYAPAEWWLWHVGSLLNAFSLEQILAHWHLVFIEFVKT